MAFEKQNKVINFTAIEKLFVKFQASAAKHLEISQFSAETKQRKVVLKTK